MAQYKELCGEREKVLGNVKRALESGVLFFICEFAADGLSTMDSIEGRNCYLEIDVQGRDN